MQGRLKSFVVARFARARISYYLPALLFCLAVGTGLYLMDGDRQRQYIAAERLETSKRLADISARLDARINANVNLVQGLVTMMGVRPVETQAEFTTLAASLLSRPSEIKVLAGAPGMVVSMIFPYEMNRRALGLDYRKNDEQRPGVLRARDTRQMVLTGPIHLVQGGTGLIARYPVFRQDDGSFWGIVSAIIDLDKLYRDSGFGLASGLDVAIYKDNPQKEKAVFYGDPAVLERSPVELSLKVGIDRWHLAATPAEGWGDYATELKRFRAYTVLIAIAIIIPLAWAALLAKQRQANMRVLRESEEQLETLSQRLGLALKASEIGVWEYMPATDTLIWDQRMRELYGVDPSKPICEYDDWRSALHPDDLADAEATFARCLEKEAPYNTDFRVIDANGAIRYIRAHGGVFRNSNGVVRMIGANWDITRDVMMQSALRDARDQLEHQSLHDALTGLPNRRFLERLLKTEEGEEEGLGLIHADLDRFKEVNDTFGHRAGDAVLKAAADRIRSLVGPGEFASRIGGDEFVIVTRGASAEERSRSLADALVGAMSEPIDFEGHFCRIGCSAGVAVQTFRHENPLQLLGNADIALYEAKKRGRNRFEFFSDGLRLAAVQAKKTADELIVALEQDEFVPYFQPQFDAVTLDIVGAEALARWNHETRGLLTPDRFLSVAEATNRVADIDAVIFEKALFHLARWQANGFQIPSVSVNISAQRLGDDRLFDSLNRIAFKPGSVSFELLETIYLDDPDVSLVAAVRRLKAAGIDIEIDDFGSGHASIVSLLELAPKRLKIDRKLVAPIRDSLSRRQMVASIIEIGRSQGIEIVAEGVETMEHAAILRDLGCHALQGYAFAKPMPANAMMAFMRDWQERKRVLLAAG
ncbi:bifunctional diguanylate cyclase/phosphodiesterase [Gellertiella hungarica]|uniref:Diguanylate cyclase (GGDEF)-like protein n=1 Tax=Gellertiella hungarica TaxID=1572859 RepID=A0A7W6J8N6_9HYPH|nr:EAL domain-containing protein [Gellertiella hungarica]MBB4066809.1 diguanylate cyclase (GGDEF)-like protein [Gellertiella hungarica]